MGRKNWLAADAKIRRNDEYVFRAQPYILGLLTDTMQAANIGVRNLRLPGKMKVPEKPFGCSGTFLTLPL